MGSLSGSGQGGDDGEGGLGGGLVGIGGVGLEDLGVDAIAFGFGGGDAIAFGFGGPAFGLEDLGGGIGLEELDAELDVVFTWLEELDAFEIG